MLWGEYPRGLSPHAGGQGGSGCGGALSLSNPAPAPQLEVQFIVWGAHHHPEKEFCSYLQYLEYLSQNRPPPSAYELFAKGYEDYLQSPLQVSDHGCHRCGSG